MPRHKRAMWIGVILLVGIAQGAHGQSSSATLPGTQLLAIDKPLDEVMVAVSVTVPRAQEFATPAGIPVGTRLSDVGCIRQKCGA